MPKEQKVRTVEVDGEVYVHVKDTVKSMRKHTMKFIALSKLHQLTREQFYAVVIRSIERVAEEFEPDELKIIKPEGSEK